MKRWLILMGLVLVTPLCALAETSLSLAGVWRFALDRSTEQKSSGASTPELTPGDGLVHAWYAKPLPGENLIHVPGFLQAQGYGDEITPTTPWVAALGDAWWKIQPATLTDVFSKPHHVEVPFLSQPTRHYLGAAWYQREIEIPDSWVGRNIVLFIERAHWKTTVWIDNNACGSQESLVAPHITKLGTLAAGKHRLTIRIDNRTQLPAKGHLVDGHSVSDSLGATWNGMLGKIELQSTSLVWIEDAQVYPNLSKHTARIKVSLGNRTGLPGKGLLTVNTTTTNVSWDKQGGDVETEIPMRSETWDEFNPKLQHLTLTLKSTDILDERSVTFGAREISFRDKDLFINGRLVNLRTTHTGGDFPLTGAIAMDLESWRKIIRTCKNYGLNGMRFHSWCPPEAAFVAADELGFYLQPECGMWNDFGSPLMHAWLEDETKRIIEAYGNHPSFILLSPSNEPRNYQAFTPGWAKAWYKKDNRRLYSAGTGWSHPSQVIGGAQYAALVAYNNAPLRNVTGWFGHDYRDALRDIHIPVLAHEVGQWCAYPDFDIIKKFTGFLRPSNYDIFKYIAQKNGVLDYNQDFAYASGRFQLACYKEEIEANLRTPGLSGYQLLDLHDYLGQGTALIGLTDAFWEPKSYVTASEFRRFNSETVPLVRLEKRIYTNGDILSCDVEIYHFGDKPLTHAVAYWKLVDSYKQVVSEGEWAPCDIPIGKNNAVGKININLKNLHVPEAYKLLVGIKDTNAENDWNLWIYPQSVTEHTPEDVLLTHEWSEALKRLHAGGKVVYVPRSRVLDTMVCPPMKRIPVFWNIQMTVRPPQNPNPRFDAMLGLLCDVNHPALALFPTTNYCDWQWTSLIDNVRSINLTKVSPQLRPIVFAIDDWNRNWKLGVIFECRVGEGRLLVSAIDIDQKDGNPVLRQLRRSLLSYAGSNKFMPNVALMNEEISGLWLTEGSQQSTLPVTRKFDADLNDGSIPAPKL